MLCGGTTVYSPLKKYGAGTTAKDVGVIGIGGLGHFALIFAKAMGANVTAISHSANKEEDAKKMGASRFIATGDDAAAAIKGKERSLDLIICSSSEWSSSSCRISDAYKQTTRRCHWRHTSPFSSPVDTSY